MPVTKKQMILVGMIISIILVVYLANLFSNYCPYDGLGTAYYVSTIDFDANFYYLTLEIGDEKYIANNLPQNEEAQVRNFAETNYVAYETHDCHGSTYFIKVDGVNIAVSEEKMMTYMKQIGRTIMIGTAKGKLVLQQY